MQKLKPIEQEFWGNYVSSLPEANKPHSPFVEATYAGTAETTDELIELYLQGKKTAGSSLKADFIAENEPLPKINNYWIILDHKAQPKCIVKTVGIAENKFKDVPENIAQAEGEGDLSLEYWKRVHRSFYAPFLDEWGVGDIEEATVITEHFEVVYQ